jgi:asparagine synthase (glutamine-hydrolysing)
MIRRMANAVAHRGPDGLGAEVLPGAGLGVRRLAIVDPAGGDQPMANEAGTCFLICNGEIYNSVELQAELEARGHRFRSHSDVEVILHLYEDHGLAAVDRLRGMFAFALWDSTRRRLWLARDRLGILPLHYALTPDGLAFASEIKSLLAAGVDGGALNARALDDIFHLGFVAESHTLFERIHQLRPAHWLTYEAGQVKVVEYWSLLGALKAGADNQCTENEWAEQLRSKLEETVRLHLRADVPVGALLSAGLDSSLVATLAADQQPGLPTYTLTFEEAAYDETLHQRTLDQVPGVPMRNQRVWCGNQTFERYTDALWHSESPTTSLADIPHLLLGEAAAGQVKAVLTGEGSDELFGGYIWFRSTALLHSLRRLPNAARQLVSSLAAVQARWPHVRRVLPGPSEMSVERYGLIAGPPGFLDRRRFLAPDVRRQLSPDFELDEPADADAIARLDPFRQVQYFDMRLRLAGFINRSLDRGLMAAGVEARVPFLDHELVELGLRIPSGLKVHRGREKYILRRAFQGRLPNDILWRRKRGLAGPVREWLRGPLPAFAADLLSPRRVAEKGYFDPTAVAEVLARHRAGKGTDGGMLNAVLGVQLWDELFRQSRSRLERVPGEPNNQGNPPAVIVGADGPDRGVSHAEQRRQ